MFRRGEVGRSLEVLFVKIGESSPVGEARVKAVQTPPGKTKESKRKGHRSTNIFLGDRVWMGREAEQVKIG